MSLILPSTSSPALRQGAGQAVRAAAAALLAIAFLLSCRGQPSPPKIIVIGLDGMDPDLLKEKIDAGRMPVLAGLARRGSFGRIQSLEPMVSPLLWTSVATGVTADKHGIMDFVEPNPKTGALMSVTRARRRRPALWGILGRAGLRSGVVCFWATYPAEDIPGWVISDRIVSHGFRENPAAAEGLVAPSRLRALAMGNVTAASDLSYESVRRLASVTEGEWRLSRDRPPSDRLKHLAIALADTLSIQRMALALEKEEPVDVLFVYFEAIDTVSHLFMRDRDPRAPAGSLALSKVEGPYAATVDRFYELQDELLAPLVELASRSTTVIVLSDHGFRHGDDRPSEGEEFDEGTAVRWHRKEGCLLAAGPTVKPGAALSGSLLDIAPTVLALLSQPVASDMDGKPIASVASEVVARVASYGEEEARGIPGGVEDPELVERLRSLGYVGGEKGAAPSPGDTARSRFHAGLALQGQGKEDEAMAEYRKALQLDPSYLQAKVNLGALTLRHGDRLEARRIFEEVLAQDPKQVGAMNDLAVLYLESGRGEDRERAEALLRRAIETDPSGPVARKNLGVLLAERGDLKAGEEMLREAVRLTPEDGKAWAALAQVARAAGDREVADQAAARARAIGVPSR